MRLSCVRALHLHNKLTRPFEYNETTVFQSSMYTLQESFKGDGYRDYSRELLQLFSQMMAVAGFFKKLMTTFVLSQISNF